MGIYHFLRHLIFCPKAIKPSVLGKRVLLELALADNDLVLLNWLAENVVYEFSDCPLVSGWTEMGSDGKIRVYLKASDLSNRSARTLFRSAHELKHVRQLLDGVKEPPLRSQAHYRLELEANDYAIRLVCIVTEVRFFCLVRFKLWRRLLSYAATYPFEFHSLWLFSISCGTWQLVEAFLNSRFAERIFDLVTSIGRLEKNDVDKVKRSVFQFELRRV